MSLVEFLVLQIGASRFIQPDSGYRSAAWPVGICYKEPNRKVLPLKISLLPLNKLDGKFDVSFSPGELLLTVRRQLQKTPALSFKLISNCVQANFITFRILHFSFPLKFLSRTSSIIRQREPSSNQKISVRFVGKSRLLIMV